jgi:hypothetical protein
LRDVHSPRHFPQADAGSESGFDLPPRFCGYLAAHVRLNLTASASDCKVAVWKVFHSAELFLQFRALFPFGKQ